MLLHLGQNLITLRTLLHLGSFITFRPSTALFCGGLTRAHVNMDKDYFKKRRFQNDKSYWPSTFTKCGGS